MTEILIVDDDRAIGLLLSKLSKNMGYQADWAQTLDEAFNLFNSNSYDLILLDLVLPDGNGLNALPTFLKPSFAPEVIIITGTGDIEGAELAFKSGAWDFIPKPLKPSEVILSISRALQFRHEKLTVKKPKVLKREGIIGESAEFKTCLELVAQAAATDAGILITGETGTGKELIAQAIHNNSARSEEQFIVVDCAALPESLIESALFGHEKGAFTDASVRRSGMIKQANQGTLFLDEVGELPPSIQKTFLRVLQEHRFRPVGGDKEISSDFRLIAATNRDLDAMAKDGMFRQDLLYRLRSIAIHLPPLRERRSDIRRLIMHHIERYAEATDFAAKGCTPEFIETLMGYDWPGNVRELVNVLDQAIAMAGQLPTLNPVHLPSYIRLPQLKDRLPDDSQIVQQPSDYQKTSDFLLNEKILPSIREFREKIIKHAEEDYLKELMRRTKGRIKPACEISGLSESRLHALLKEYNTPRFRST